MKITPKKIALVACALGAASAGLSAYIWYQEHRAHVLEVYVFALKSGQSILIRTPDDERILIDGGANSEVIRHLSSILPFYSRRIDSIIATNTDGKNVSGLIDILERYTVSHAYLSGVTLNSLDISTSTDPAYETLLDSIKKKGISPTELGTGDVVTTKDSMLTRSSGPNSGVFINALFPVSGDDFAYSKASAPEILLKISYGENSVLILNDASTKVQKYIASGNSTSPPTSISATRDTDVLIVSHSAAPANMARELISAIQPRFLIYSKTVSKVAAKSTSIAKSNQKSPANKKAPPDPLAGILIDNRFNLKETGTVKITSDGKNLEISQ